MRRASGTLAGRNPSHDHEHDPSPGVPTLDGLPYAEGGGCSCPGCRYTLPRLSTGDVASGLTPELKDELSRRSVEFDALQTRRARHQSADPELSVYELEVAEAMTARRDAALHLKTVLTEDIAQYEGGMAAIRAGLAKEILVPSVGGSFRQCVSDAMAELEVARHRFRLALVAVALDNGMTAGQIGEAFAFSRQLAGRYLKEARTRWPELRQVPAVDDPGATVNT